MSVNNLESKNGVVSHSQSTMFDFILGWESGNIKANISTHFSRSKKLSLSPIISNPKLGRNLNGNCIISVYHIPFSTKYKGKIALQLRVTRGGIPGDEHSSVL